MGMKKKIIERYSTIEKVLIDTDFLNHTENMTEIKKAEYLLSCLLLAHDMKDMNKFLGFN